MNLVLQSQAGSCPIAPEADLNVAISLLQMSVLGLPLLLALFQFVNDHEYDTPEDDVSLRTVLYGLVMMTSAFLLLGFYYAAFCMIYSAMGVTDLTTLLLLFMAVMLAIIMVILLIQMEQMVGEGARYSLIAYLWGILVVMSSLAITNLLVRAGLVLLAMGLVGMGWIDQTIGLEQAGERVRAGWREWKAVREDGEETEGVEGMDSVYK